jgi:diguanylate cyclase (GGDEF)-like protein
MPPLSTAAVLLLLAAGGPAAAQPEAARDLLAQSRAAVRGDPDRSRALAEQALGLLVKQPDADLEVQAHAQLCDHHSERDRAAAERHLKSGQALLARTTRPALAAQLLECDGLLHEFAGDTVQALALYDRAVSVAETASDEPVLASTLYQRGYLRGVRGELAAGLADLRRSNDLYTKRQMGDEALNTLLAAALLYSRLGDHQEARRHFERALAAQRSAGQMREQAVTQHNLGRALENLGDRAAARASFADALAISQKLDFPRGQAYALRGLASVANGDGDGAAALRHASAAAALLAKAPDERLRAQVALQRGIALRLLKRGTESLVALNEALRIFQAADSRVELTTTRGELSKTMAELGDFKGALEQADAFKAASDDLLKRQIEERFASLRIEMATVATERENEALRRANAEAERALQQEQRANLLRTVSLALAGVLVVVLSALLWRHWRTSARMRGLAMTDELTQLPNRRHALATLQALLADGGGGAVLIADLDLFKPINDEYGHLVGDEILRRVADALRRAVPPGAQLGRLGGEEFVVILPGADRAEALRVAEATRAEVEALDVSRWLSGRGVTISLGATACVRGDPLGAILRRADEALYAAKDGGRNAVRWLSAEPGAAIELPAAATPRPVPAA